MKNLINHKNLYSIPAWLGKAKALRVSELLHLLVQLVYCLQVGMGNFGWLVLDGCQLFLLVCLIYQHSIVKPNDLKRVNIAFMTANGIAQLYLHICYCDLFIN